MPTPQRGQEREVPGDWSKASSHRESRQKASAGHRDLCTGKRMQLKGPVCTRPSSSARDVSPQP